MVQTRLDLSIILIIVNGHISLVDVKSKVPYVAFLLVSAGLDLFISIEAGLCLLFGVISYTMVTLSRNNFFYTSCLKN